MKRLFFETVRILILLLLSMVSLLTAFWGGRNFYLTVSAPAAAGYADPAWLAISWFAALTSLGLLLLIASWRLWRRNGSGYGLAMRALAGAFLLSALDGLWLWLYRRTLMGTFVLSWPLAVTWVILAVLRLPGLRDDLVFDRIASGKDTLSRLDMLD